MRDITQLHELSEQPTYSGSRTNTAVVLGSCDKKLGGHYSGGLICVDK